MHLFQKNGFDELNSTIDSTFAYGLLLQGAFQVVAVAHNMNIVPIGSVLQGTFHLNDCHRQQNSFTAVTCFYKTLFKRVDQHC